MALSGQLRLWRVFWFGHFLAYWIITAFYGLLAAAFESNVFSALYLPILLGYMAFVYLAIWRCSMNVDKKIWGYLAKIYSGLALASYIVGIITIPIALLTR